MIAIFKMIILKIKLVINFLILNKILHNNEKMSIFFKNIISLK